MSDPYNYGRSIQNVGRQVMQIGGSLAAANAEAQVNQAVHAFDMLSTEVMGAIQLRDNKALEAVSAKFQAMQLDEGGMKAAREGLLQNHFQAQIAAGQLNADEAYALSDAEVGKWGAAYSDIMYAAKESAVNSVRGRSAQRQLARALDAKIAAGFGSFTQQAVEWKITETKNRSKMAAENAVLAMIANPEQEEGESDADWLTRSRGNLEETNKAIENHIVSNPYFSETEQQGLIEAYQHQALVKWANDHAMALYERGETPVDENGQIMLGKDGNPLVDPYYAAQQAMEDMDTTGLTAAEIATVEANITAQANKDWDMEVTRRRRHDEEMNQEMTDLYSNQALTREAIQSKYWWDHTQELKWYDRLERQEAALKAATAGGASRAEIKDNYWGLCDVVARESGATNKLEIIAALEESPLLAEMRLQNVYLWKTHGEIIGGNYFDDILEAGTLVDSGVISSAKNLIKQGIPDDVDRFGQAAAMVQLEKLANEARLSGEKLTPAMTESFAHELISQYRHTKGIFMDDDAVRRYRTREVGAFGFEGDRDAKAINVREEIAMSIAEGEFANWLFYDNGEPDYTRLSNWLEAVGVADRVEKLGFDPNLIIEEYLSGPAQAMGSLGEGYTYDGPEMLGLDTPIPIHAVRNANGEQEKYIVMVEPIDSEREGAGTECWYRVEEDENGALVNRGYAGPVRTGAQLREMQDKIEGQREDNAKAGFGAVTDVEKDRILLIEQDLGRIRQAQLESRLAERAQNPKAMTRQDWYNLNNPDPEDPSSLTPENTRRIAVDIFNAGDSAGNWEKYVGSTDR